MYTDLGFKNSDAEFHFDFTRADNFVGVEGASPVQLLNVGWNKIFTNGGTTNQLAMESGNATINATDNLSFAAVGYYRHFIQSHFDANIANAADCGPGPEAGTVCIDGEQALDQTGNPIPTPSNPALGETDRTGEDARSYGTSLQAVEKAPIFGHSNQFLVGASYDHGNVNYNASSELGIFGPDAFFLHDTGFIFSSPIDVAPRALNTTNDYTGIYFSDTFDVTDKFSLTTGGRWNLAIIQIADETGNFPNLNGTNTYARFNPMGGFAYKINPGLSFYGGYSEANRAPVAAELSCADPLQPCLIESFLTSDPPLQQVVSNTWSAGLRDEQTIGANKLQWGIGVFRTKNFNDIITVFSPVAGRGVFENGGATQRQGVDANISYKTDRWFLYANYAFIDATFLNALTLTSLSPFATTCPGTVPADQDNCVFVRPGDQLPGIPQNRLKLGADYWITTKWKFGGDLLAASGQFFFGDQSNQDKPVGGYTRVDLHTSYDLTPRVQLFGLINNLFDQHYGLFGGYTNLVDANIASQGVAITGPNFFTNARTIVPAAPVVAYGGVKVKLW
jgi:outer membrane receptor protein involved in Fe transport